MESKSVPSILVGSTSTVYSTLLDEVFTNVARSQFSSDVAIVFEECGVVVKLTYLELDALSNRLARSIYKVTQESNGVRNTDGDFVVAISIRPSDCLIATLLAIWKAGMTVLPLDLSSKARVQHILQEAHPILVICDDDNNLISQKITYTDLLRIGSKYSCDPLSNDECYKGQSIDEIAAILYTSGSTGVPKGVRLSHANILNRLQWQFETFPYPTTEKTVIFKTALTFADSIGEIWGPLLNGLAVLVAPHGTTLNPDTFICLLEKYEIERLVLVPSLLEAMLEYLEANNRKESLKHLKTWICSGEALRKSLVESFYNYFPNEDYRLCNFYGSTEITADATYYVISSLAQVEGYRNVPIGVPLNNVIVYLLTSDLTPTGEGEVGEMYISGLNLSKGYVGGFDAMKFLKNPFAEQPEYHNLYRTGDFARLENGILIYEGRTDSQIKVRGHRVDLAEIERTLTSIRGVLKGVVLCYDAGQPNQAILAFVTVENNTTESYIEKILKDTLPNYMLPQLLVMDALPLLPSGKIDRQVLFEKYEGYNTNSIGPTVDYKGVPENEMEAAKALFETIVSVINKPSTLSISLDSNFYEIGGNSLNTILTIAALKRKGYEIDVESFIAATSVKELLSIIGDKCGRKCAPSVTSSYTMELLREEHKSEVIDIVVIAFSQKGNLEQFLPVRSTAVAADFDLLMRCIWDSLLQAELSFVVKTLTGKIVGVTVNTDIASSLSIDLPYLCINPLIEILEYIEQPFIKGFLAKNSGKALHNILSAVPLNLSTKENISILKFIDEEVIKVAKLKNFEGIFSTNVNPLTQQLASNVFFYTTLLDYQVNTFVAKDKSKPFASAPNSIRLLVQWKAVKEEVIYFSIDTTYFSQ